MERAFRQSAVVGDGGRIELNTPELAPGTEIEAILLVRDSDASERERLAQAILEGEADVAAGRTRSAPAFFAEHTDRYGVPG